MIIKAKRVFIRALSPLNKPACQSYNKDGLATSNVPTQLPALLALIIICFQVNSAKSPFEFIKVADRICHQ
jgi:hypothetical protein